MAIFGERLVAERALGIAAIGFGLVVIALRAWRRAPGSALNPPLRASGRASTSSRVEARRAVKSDFRWARAGYRHGRTLVSSGSVAASHRSSAIRRPPRRRRLMYALLLAVVAAGAAWWFLRPRAINVETARGRDDVSLAAIRRVERNGLRRAATEGSDRVEGHGTARVARRRRRLAGERRAK